MATVIKEQRGTRTLLRIQWQDENKRRRHIRLSGVSLRDANALAPRIQSLVSAKITGTGLSTDMAIWLAGLGDDLHGRLAEHGLCEPRKRATLAAFIDDFCSGRTDAKPLTLRNWRTRATS